MRKRQNSHELRSLPRARRQRRDTALERSNPLLEDVDRGLYDLATVSESQARENARS